MFPRSTLATLLAAIALTGCVRRGGRNSDCNWPGEPDAKRLRAGEPGYEQHLTEDAEFAEELAIRYMDSHYGPRSGKFESHLAAGQAKNRCLGVLFGEIGKTHEITPDDVFKYFGHRRIAIDLAVNLPFVLLHGLLAGLVAGRIRGRYPPSDGWLAAVVVIILSSIVFGAGAVIFGELWSTLAEMIRVGNGHLSVRTDRLPWAQHRIAIFTSASLLFWIIAAVRLRTVQRAE